MPRGGKREGAGRKAGVQTAKTLQRRAIAEKAVAKGITPLEVMLANMRHFHKLAESAEAALTEISADRIAGLAPPEQFKFLLAEVKKAAGLRELAQGCARDAASYLHPRLTAISAPDGGPVKTIHEIRHSIVPAGDRNT
jgi:hypothetical protein